VPQCLGQFASCGINLSVYVYPKYEIGEVFLRGCDSRVSHAINMLRMTPPFLPPLESGLPVCLLQQVFGLRYNCEVYPFSLGGFMYDQSVCFVHFIPPSVYKIFKQRKGRASGSDDKT
jgi:hypothetical protein